MKAQAFTVFKMLIASVLALALLVIIYGALEMINPPYSGFESVRDLVTQATALPGKCFERKVYFSQGEIISEQGLEASLEGVTVTIEENGGFQHTTEGYEAITKLNIPVSVTCTMTGTTTSCTIYLNKPCS